MRHTSNPLTPKPCAFIPSRASAALALCAASLLHANSSSAQSSVTFNGLVDISIGSTRAAGSKHATSNVSSGSLTTSWYGLKGAEDLGGGWAAIFQLETFFRADDGEQGRYAGDAFWSRSSFVGISNPKWGRLTFGRSATSLFSNSVLFNAVEGSFGYSPTIRHYYRSGTVTGDSVWNDSIAYTSPSMSGFIVSASASLPEGNGGRKVGAGVTYMRSGFGLGAAWQKARNSATSADTETSQLSTSYDFGVAKLFAQTGRVNNQSTRNRFDIHGVGLSVPLGPGRAFAQYGVLLDAAAADRRTVTLGYSHFLSKRTDVYWAAMSERVDGLSSGRSFALGLRHRF
ncbi:porin [Variovorax atrisoli]|uniref:porin n=1 Tax=Variovorax atrisoli TaxID=3394203 RepID=UPI0016138528|nr:porin [Variovorax sp. BK613]MBB3638923.1 putative porin [Variovorax sp. BK613]